jgi:hypothetical protein
MRCRFIVYGAALGAFPASYLLSRKKRVSPSRPSVYPQRAPCYMLLLLCACIFIGLREIRRPETIPATRSHSCVKLETLVSAFAAIDFPSYSPAGPLSHTAVKNFPAARNRTHARWVPRDLFMATIRVKRPQGCCRNFHCKFTRSS